MPFHLGQRVRVLPTAWEFGDAVGTVSIPPPGINDIASQIWGSHMQVEKRKNGFAQVYWVQFDQPEDDGSGDGPYLGAGIDETDLEPEPGSD